MNNQIHSLLAAASEEDAPTWRFDEAPPALPDRAACAARIDYKQYKRTYNGPTTRTNWIWPQKILCGDRTALHKHIPEMAAAGITTFYSLQTKGESDPYEDGVRKAIPTAKFLSLPIVDQKTTDDARVAALVLDVLRRVNDGEVIYIHCRGGHGRTGTVCSVLLGALYGLEGLDAASAYQMLHDLRDQPVFTSSCGYEANADSCAALFPEQREQVVRLLRPLELTPPTVHKGLSDAYGKGASKYSEETLVEWKERGLAASEAAKRKDWDLAATEFTACVSLRPDWEKGHACLQKAKEKAAMQAAAAPDGTWMPATEEAAAIKRQASGSGTSSGATTGTSTAPLGSHVPAFVVLVGLPGSGKSTFAKALARSRDEWTVIDSDETGGRRATEDAISNACREMAAKSSSRVVVDRCNVTAADRAALLDLALPLLPPRYSRERKTASSIVAVHFDVPAATCIERVAARVDHPSIPYGHGRPAVESMAKKLEVPELKKTSEHERMRWITVKTPEEIDELLKSWGASSGADVIPSGYFKFPRTRHVLNTGGTAVTRDDLVMEPDLASRFFDGKTIIIADEKVDGSNLGLSLTKEYEIRCQNRSHYVNTNSHAQFKPLGGWLEANGWALCQLLEPEVEVLFGEWCHIVHSCVYTKLPGQFIAFDIYNKRTGTFASASERNRRLEGLGIPVVNTLARRAFSSKAELLELLESRSAYSDNFVEGAYLRIDDEEKGVNTMRGKIVRPDFIQNINEGEHWIKGEMVKNQVRPDLWVELS